MDSFEKREEGFERAFSRQEELRFKAKARRNRKLGAWVAEQLGLSAAQADARAAALAERQLDAPDDEALVAELRAALPSVSEHRIRRRLEEFDAQALAELQTGR